MSAVAVGQEPLVEVHDLARHFGGVQAVRGASFNVERGSITGLIGPNGAGKSTLVDVVSGFVAPSGGRVVFDADDITGWPAHRIARRGLVRTFQLSSECPRLTVLENLLIASPDVDSTTVVRSLFGKRRWRLSERLAVDAAQELLVNFGLAHAQDAFAGELSGGQKRLLEIMRGLMSRPSLLLLDEPLAGVNPTLALEVERLLESLRDTGLTMVLIEHELGAVERLCDKVIVMALGRVIAEGTMEEMRAHPEVVDAYLG
jgi:ABC-type branched-subunit amino acid transport system ATPase component